ncbi:MAG: helix-turn-helix domain-containing protein [Planctomycetaceae bacterium]
MEIKLDSADLQPLVREIVREALAAIEHAGHPLNAANAKAHAAGIRPAEPQPLLLGLRDAAKLLSVSEKTLWNHTKPRGQIPCVNIGQRVLYDPGDLQAWIANAKAAAVAPRISEKLIEPASGRR